MKRIRSFFRLIAEFQKNWIVAVSVRISVVLIALSLGLFAWRYSSLPSLVPLWYSKPWGAEELAPPVYLLLLPVGSLVWFIIDVLVIGWQGNRYRIFTQTLFLATLLVSFLSFITLIKILFLVS